jgi:hypothetical protein
VIASQSAHKEDDQLLITSLPSSFFDRREEHFVGPFLEQSYRDKPSSGSVRNPHATPS